MGQQDPVQQMARIEEALSRLDDCANAQGPFWTGQNTEDLCVARDALASVIGFEFNLDTGRFEDQRV